ncbi:sugar ABC transporter substrate-binding protein [Kutzneria viridogrisea]|uniref:Multiple sugar transport system substrate-binding protein n=1 Tax=Kutzneria viridogrisea TaxID=47990 RepID=A0ABR6BHK3_9PSEU|nr:multiple sugar transport system substrate-binding protein [Kutzneria viridogrisea]
MSQARYQPARYQRRQFFGLAGGVAAAGLLAACGSNNGRGNGATIEQWYHAYGEAGVQQAVERYAKAYDKAAVHVQWNPGDYDSKLASGLAGSSGPDVFESTLHVDMVRAKQVVSLDDLLGDARADFTESVLASHTVDGAVYGIPQAVDMQMLFYRKSLLDKAGVTPPTTVDELVDAAHRLTSDKVKGLFLGNDGGVGVLAGPLLWSAGLDYLTPDHKVGFDDPATVTAIGKLRGLFTSGSLLLGAPTDWADPAAFTQGLTAMQWSGLWAVPAVQKALGSDFGVLPWPRLTESGKQSVPFGAYGSMVSAKSQKVNEAKAFVKWLWLDRTDYQADFDLNYGFHIPARKSIVAKADKLRTGVAADAVRFVQELGRSSNPPQWTSKMQSAFSELLSRTVRSGGDASGELRTAVQAVQTELKRLYG